MPSPQDRVSKRPGNVPTISLPPPLQSTVLLKPLDSLPKALTPFPRSVPLKAICATLVKAKDGCSRSTERSGIHRVELSHTGAEGAPHMEGGGQRREEKQGGPAVG